MFDVKQATLSNANPWLGVVTSPNEFSLVRLDVRTNRREIIVAKSNTFRYATGTDERANIEFTFVRMRPGVYRVIPAESLPAGQYAFVSNAGMSAYGNGRLYDFGVQEGK